MPLLVGFAFLGGVVTILSPCILPVLPIVLSGSVTEGRCRPLGVILGFILSFTLFTLFLTAIVNATGIPADSLRTAAVIILVLFGLTLLVPALQKKIEVLFSKLASRGQSGEQRHGFGGGFLIGLSLGLLWTPCVGPILASVISLALTGSVTGSAAVITLAYAVGTAIPMFVIMLLGRTLFQKVPWLLKNTARIQQVFGFIMIITAVAIIFNVDRKFQTYVLEKFPSYGRGLTSIEDNQSVLEELEAVDGKPQDSLIGKPMFDMDATGTKAPELVAGGQWFNSDPLALQDLKGKKVVMLDFWTYSCINCIRTLPYLDAWYEKYKDQGFEIIAVHTPEFEFEKDPENVQRAIDDYGIKYPVMQDNDYATWEAYENRYWPRKYLIDINGNVVYDHIGEGGYEETELKIQELLEVVKKQDISEDTVSPEGVIQKSVGPTTPELYFGALRNALLGNGEKFTTGTQNFTLPQNRESNTVYLAGIWNITDEYAENASAGSSVVLPYQATNVYMVASADVPVEVRVIEDGVLKNSFIVSEEKLYTVLENSGYMKNELTIEVEAKGFRIFTFTFG